MRSLFTLLCCLFLIAISSCRKDFETISSYGKLAFSKDTVFLDTVFSNIGSATYNLKVYNRGNNAITVPQIKLKNGEVDATLDLGGAAVSMELKSGEIWVFRHDGKFNLALEPSVYLETGRLKPRASQQVVLSGRAVEYATRIRWSLSKTQETAIGVRDLNRDEPDLVD